MSAAMPEDFALRGRGLPLLRAVARPALLAERLATFALVRAPASVVAPVRITETPADLSALAPQPCSAEAPPTHVERPAAPELGVQAIAVLPAIEEAPAVEAQAAGIPRPVTRGPEMARAVTSSRPLSVPEASDAGAAESRQAGLRIVAADIAVPGVAGSIGKSARREPDDRERGDALMPGGFPRTHEAAALPRAQSDAPSFREQASGAAPSGEVQRTVAAEPDRHDSPARPTAPAPEARPHAIAVRAEGAAAVAPMGMPEDASDRPNAVATPQPPHRIVDRLAALRDQSREQTLHIGSVHVIVRQPAPAASPPVRPVGASVPAQSLEPRRAFESTWTRSRNRYD